MHNLFLGTAKHVARDIWIRRSILDISALNKIETRLKAMVVPAGLGQIPISINTGFFLTAEKWKNCTLFIYIYCLGDLFELECWRQIFCYKCSNYI